MSNKYYNNDKRDDIDAPSAVDLESIEVGFRRIEKDLSDLRGVEDQEGALANLGITIPSSSINKLQGGGLIGYLADQEFVAGSLHEDQYFKEIPLLANSLYSFVFTGRFQKSWSGGGVTSYLIPSFDIPIDTEVWGQFRQANGGRGYAFKLVNDEYTGSPRRFRLIETPDWDSLYMHMVVKTGPVAGILTFNWEIESYTYPTYIATIGEGATLRWRLISAQ